LAGWVVITLPTVTTFVYVPGEAAITIPFVFVGAIAPPV
jgi:hypothetical protein